MKTKATRRTAITRSSSPIVNLSPAPVVLVKKRGVKRNVTRKRASPMVDLSPSLTLPNGDQAGSTNGTVSDLARRVVPRLITATRRHTQLQRAELRLSNQIRAIERTLAERPEIGSDLAQFVAPTLVACRDFIAAQRKPQKKLIESLAESLPIWPEVEKIRGVGAFGLGLIIGEAGDLSRYANPAKLWKRMGLAVGADGKAQRRIKGIARGGKTKHENTLAAIAQGFSPRRRALMHNIGDSLMKLNDGIYRQLYGERKATELERLPEIKGRRLWAHRRALRVIEKRFLLDLWRMWRDHPTAANQRVHVPTSSRVNA